MEITWLGHSCFRLRSDQLAILTDPFPDSIGLQMGEQQALAVTVSHHHAHHGHGEGVGGDPKLIRGPGEYELSGIYITGMMTPRGEEDPPEKRNTVYLIEMEHLRLCHLGDISGVLSSRQVEELKPLDILFLPVGGVCTLGISRAMEIVQNLGPRVVIPMHYSLPGLRMELMGLDLFLKEMGLSEVQPQARLNVTTSTLPQEMRMVILEAQGVRVQV